ncbi:MAG: hypothetical protein AAGI23_14045 [Bacteroidota bacterium]
MRLQIPMFLPTAISIGISILILGLLFTFTRMLSHRTTQSNFPSG